MQKWKIMQGAVVLGALVLAGCTSQPAAETQVSSFSEKPVAAPVEMKEYTLAEVITHNTKEDCWTVLQGKVYDITSAVPKHPAGPDKASNACGQDISENYLKNPKHAGPGLEMLEGLQIGVVKK